MITLADLPPVSAVATIESDVVTLAYVTSDTHAARVSLDVAALSALPGFALVESWMPPHALDAPVVCLRYVAAPLAPPPVVAPAPVPASPSRRR